MCFLQALNTLIIILICNILIAKHDLHILLIRNLRRVTFINSSIIKTIINQRKLNNPSLRATRLTIQKSNPKNHHTGNNKRHRKITAFKPQNTRLIRLHIILFNVASLTPALLLRNLRLGICLSILLLLAHALHFCSICLLHIIPQYLTPKN